MYLITVTLLFCRRRKHIVQFLHHFVSMFWLGLLVMSDMGKRRNCHVRASASGGAAGRARCCQEPGSVFEFRVVKFVRTRPICLLKVIKWLTRRHWFNSGSCAQLSILSALICSISPGHFHW